MAYDQQVAARVRHALGRRKGLTEKKMFGGIAFMLDSNMCCGVLDKDLVLRLGNDGAEAALTEKHVREMDFTGRPMRSMVYLAAAGFRSDDALKARLKRAADFARSLPPK